MNPVTEGRQPEQWDGSLRLGPLRGHPRGHPHGADEIQFGTGDSSLGLVLAAQSARGLCAVLFGDDRRTLRRELQSRFPEATLVEGGDALDALVARVIQLVESPSRGLDVPVDLRGT